jgi:hypothetical protein
MNRLATFPEYLNYMGITPYIGASNSENVQSDLKNVVDPVTGQVTGKSFSGVIVDLENTPVNTKQTPLYQVIKTIHDNVVGKTKFIISGSAEVLPEQIVQTHDLTYENMGAFVNPDPASYWPATQASDPPSKLPIEELPTAANLPAPVSTEQEAAIKEKADQMQTDYQTQRPQLIEEAKAGLSVTLYEVKKDILDLVDFTIAAAVPSVMPAGGPEVFLDLPVGPKTKGPPFQSGIGAKEATGYDALVEDLPDADFIKRVIGYLDRVDPPPEPPTSNTDPSDQPPAIPAMLLGIVQLAREQVGIPPPSPDEVVDIPPVGGAIGLPGGIFSFIQKNATSDTQAPADLTKPTDDPRLVKWEVFSQSQGFVKACDQVLIPALKLAYLVPPLPPLPAGAAQGYFQALAPAMALVSINDLPTAAPQPDGSEADLKAAAQGNPDVVDEVTNGYKKLLGQIATDLSPLLGTLQVGSAKILAGYLSGPPPPYPTQTKAAVGKSDPELGQAIIEFCVEQLPPGDMRLNGIKPVVA